MDESFAEFMMEKEYFCGLAKVTLKGYRVSWRTFKRLVKEPEINKATFLMTSEYPARVHPKYFAAFKIGK
jgi:hypothetical protein